MASRERSDDPTQARTKGSSHNKNIPNSYKCCLFSPVFGSLLFFFSPCVSYLCLVIFVMSSHFLFISLILHIQIFIYFFKKCFPVSFLFPETTGWSRKGPGATGKVSWWQTGAQEEGNEESRIGKERLGHVFCC